MNQLSMQMFDSITYEKGGSMLHMLRSYLPGDTFIKGLRLYLHRHQFSNADAHDFWEAMSEAAGDPVPTTSSLLSLTFLSMFDKTCPTENYSLPFFSSSFCLLSFSLPLLFCFPFLWNRCEYHDRLLWTSSINGPIALASPSSPLMKALGPLPLHRYERDR